MYKQVIGLSRKFVKQQYLKINLYSFCQQQKILDLDHQISNKINEMQIEQNNEKYYEDFIDLDYLINPSGIEDFIYIAKKYQNNFPIKISTLYFKSFIHILKKTTTVKQDWILQNRDLQQFLRNQMKRITDKGTDQEFLDLMVLLSLLNKAYFKIKDNFSDDCDQFKDKLFVRIKNGNYDIRSLLNFYLNNIFLNTEETFLLENIILSELTQYEMNQNDSLIYRRLQESFQISQNNVFKVRIFKYLDERCHNLENFSYGIQLQLLLNFVHYNEWLEGTKLSQKMHLISKNITRISYGNIIVLFKYVFIQIQQDYLFSQFSYCKLKQSFAAQDKLNLCQKFYQYLLHNSSVNKQIYYILLQCFLILQSVKIQDSKISQQVDQLTDNLLKFYHQNIVQNDDSSYAKFNSQVDFLMFQNDSYLPMKKKIQCIIDRIASLYLQNIQSYSFIAIQQSMILFLLADKKYSKQFYEIIQKRQDCIVKNQTNQGQIFLRILHIYNNKENDEEIAPMKIQQEKDKSILFQFYPKNFNETQIKKFIKLFDNQIFAVVFVMFHQDINCFERGLVQMSDINPIKQHLNSTTRQMQNSFVLNLFCKFLVQKIDENNKLIIIQILRQIMGINYSVRLIIFSSSNFYRLLYNFKQLEYQELQNLKQVLFQTIFKQNAVFCQPVYNSMCKIFLQQKKLLILIDFLFPTINYQSLFIHPYIIKNLIYATRSFLNQKILFYFLVYYNTQIQEQVKQEMQNSLAQYLEQHKENQTANQISLLYKFYLMEKPDNDIKEQFLEILKKQSTQDNLFIASHLMKICIIKKQGADILCLFEQLPDYNCYLSMFAHNAFSYISNEYIFEIFDYIFKKNIPTSMLIFRFSYSILCNRFLISYFLQNNFQQVNQYINIKDSCYKEFFKLEIFGLEKKKLEIKEALELIKFQDQFQLDQVINILGITKEQTEIEYKNEIAKQLFQKATKNYFYDETFMLLIMNQYKEFINLKEFEDMVSKIKDNKQWQIYLEQFYILLSEFRISHSQLQCDGFKFGTFLLNDYDTIVFVQQQNEYIQEVNKKQIEEFAKEKFPNYKVYFYKVYDLSQIQNLIINLEILLKQNSFECQNKKKKLEEQILYLKNSYPYKQQKLDFQVYFNPYDIMSFINQNTLYQLELQTSNENSQFKWYLNEKSDLLKKLKINDLQEYINKEADQYLKFLPDNTSKEYFYRISPENLQLNDSFFQYMISEQIQRKYGGWQVEYLEQDSQTSLEQFKYEKQEDEILYESDQELI